MELPMWMAVVMGMVVAVVWHLLSPIAGKQQRQAGANSVPQVGELTLETLETYCGYDPFRPILVAIKGAIYDVSSDYSLFKPGAELHVFAGRECARALAKGVSVASECNSNLNDLDEQEVALLGSSIAEYQRKYPVVGKIVPLKSLTLKELSKFNGADKDVPMYLAIKGLVFDISKSPQFYGPDGMYPFAGQECARAFALMSTDVSDCTDNLDGLEVGELDSLKEWEAKFRVKYPVVGRILSEGSEG